jgi:hypothetical protein
MSDQDHELTYVPLKDKSIEELTDDILDAFEEMGADVDRES